MPKYDFHCEACGEEFEVECHWREKERTTCPKCGGGKLKEIFRGFLSFSTSGSEAAGGCGSCGAAGSGGGSGFR